MNNKLYLQVQVSIIVWICLVLAAVMFFSSCNSSRRVNRVMTRHPQAAAAVCGRMFPPVASTRTTVEYLPGKPVAVPGDTVYVDCDSAVAAIRQGAVVHVPAARVTIPCPPSLIRIDTLKLHDTTVVENNALLYECRETVQSQDRKISRQGTTITWLWWLTLAGWGLHLLRILIKKFTRWL